MDGIRTGPFAPKSFVVLLPGEIWPGLGGSWPVSTKGVIAIGARISGVLDLEGTSLNRTLWLHKCALDGPVTLIDAECRTISLRGSCLAGGLIGTRAVISGNLVLSEGFSAKGEINLVRAKIDGQLVCSGGRFDNPGAIALNADALMLTGSAYLRDGFLAKGEVLLDGPPRPRAYRRSTRLHRMWIRKSGGVRVERLLCEHSRRCLPARRFLGSGKGEPAAREDRRTASCRGCKLENPGGRRARRTSRHGERRRLFLRRFLRKG